MTGFENALRSLLIGKEVRRLAWSRRSTLLVSSEILMLRGVDGGRSWWWPTSADLMAEDWVVPDGAASYDDLQGRAQRPWSDAGLDFSLSLIRVKQGGTVRRAAWPEARCLAKAAWARSVLVLRSGESTTEWTPKHEDLLAKDWQWVPAAPHKADRWLTTE